MHLPFAQNIDLSGPSSYEISLWFPILNFYVSIIYLSQVRLITYLILHHLLNWEGCDAHCAVEIYRRFGERSFCFFRVWVVKYIEKEVYKFPKLSADVYQWTLHLCRGFNLQAYTYVMWIRYNYISSHSTFYRPVLISILLNALPYNDVCND